MPQYGKIAPIKIRFYPGGPPRMAEGSLALAPSTISGTTGVSLFVGATNEDKNIEILDRSDTIYFISSDSASPLAYNLTENVTALKPQPADSVVVWGEDPGAAVVEELKDKYGAQAQLVYGTTVFKGDNDDSLSAIAITAERITGTYPGARINTVNLSAYNTTVQNHLTANTLYSSNNLYINSSAPYLDVKDLFTATANLASQTQQKQWSVNTEGSDTFYHTITGAAVISASISAQAVTAATDVLINTKSVDNLFTATGNLNAVQSSLVTATGNILDGTETFTNTVIFETITANTISATDYFVRSITAEDITTTGTKLNLAGSLTISGDVIEPIETYSLEVFSQGLGSSSGDLPFIIKSDGTVGIGTQNPVAKLTVNGSISSGHLSADGLSVQSGDVVINTLSATTISGTFIDVEAFEEDGNGDLMPIEGTALTNQIWALNSENELYLKANYFQTPDWEILALFNGVGTDQLESVILV